VIQNRFASATCAIFSEAANKYAEILLRENGDPDGAAITTCHFDGKPERLTRRELRVSRALAAFLQHTGVRPGDRNGAEAIIAALAAAS
jgi:acyl-coenzyme A synthetase/AMP-(fatty) acid ligase